MSVFKCKMCGGTLEIHEHEGVVECEYCGTLQTLSKNNNETIQNLFSRANNLRLKCEFDKAEQIYEKILELDNTEAEAYWGIILCKYGIEYVEDPKTFKRIPTCHRTSYESITASADYLAALEHADFAQREIYEHEAKAIDEIQKNILSIVKNEKPFDVFICYKESDESGKRTVDSAIANDIYYQLTQEGFKVFYAAITLEDKLGQEYEPYIFAALNSAKVMLVIGTKPEYFEAVWVKNEWSRFMKLMKTDRSKLLIPCYKDMDAYDLPEDFAHLQAQDMGKIGFINDVVRGIKKVIAKDEIKKDAPAVEITTIAASAPVNTSPLLKRVFIFLEDGDFINADEYCEKVLDNDPECAEAYLGKMMAELRVRKREDLALFDEPFDENGNYKRALRFADEAFAEELRGYISSINERKENRRLEALYKNCVRIMEFSKTEEDYINAAKNFDELGSFSDSAEMANRCREKANETKTELLNKIYARCATKMNSAKTEQDFKEAAKGFDEIIDFRDSKEKKENCFIKAEEARKDAIYENGQINLKKGTAMGFSAAKNCFEEIPGWKDSDELVVFCQEEFQRLNEIGRVKEKEDIKKSKRNSGVFLVIMILAGIFTIGYFLVIVPSMDYKAALALYNEGKYEEAISAFEAMGDYKDSEEQIKICKEAILERKYQSALSLMKSGKYEEAIRAFQLIDAYSDSKKKIDECIELQYLKAVSLLEEEKYEEALSNFDLPKIRNYKDSKDKIEECKVGMFKQGVNIKFSTENEFTSEGEFKVHSINAKLSENGKKYTFTIDCTLPKNMGISFFNPPEGSAFMLTNYYGTAGRNTYTFTVSRKTVKANTSVTIRFNLNTKYAENTGWAFFQTQQLY